MKTLYTIIIIGWGCFPLWAQKSAVPTHELPKTMFVTDAYGLTANLLNPAGLSTEPEDDGALISYDFFDTQDEGNVAAGLSMGNLGFIYQSFGEDINPRFRMYALSIGIGGRILSIGTVNKIIRIDGESGGDRVDLDAGFVLRPANGIKIAGVARNLAEPDDSNYDFTMNFTGGVELSTLSESIKILAEVSWDRKGKFSEDADYRGAISITPYAGFEFRVGAINTNGNTDQYFGQVFVPLSSGLKLIGSVRTDKDVAALRYSTSLAIPLQTVRF